MAEEFQPDNKNENICSKCNKEVPDSEKKMYEGDDGKTPECICDECANIIRQEYYMATQNVNVFKALFFGILASVVTGLIWYWIAVWTNTMYSIIVLGIGFVIALACSIGADFKKGWKIQLIAILLTLLTIIYAEGLFAFHTATSESIFSHGVLGFIVTIIMLPLFAFKSLGIMGSIFSMFALWVAFVVGKKDELKQIV